MDGILDDANNAQKILRLTADGMLLIDRAGFCIDIKVYSDLWFLQEQKLRGKNIFTLLPQHLLEKVKSTFYTVLSEQRSIENIFKLELKDNTYFFNCIMHPYDDMVLCQYRDITEHSNLKQLLEQNNTNLREIQKVAKIEQWTYTSCDDSFSYHNYNGLLPIEMSKHILTSQYAKLIVEEDRSGFLHWLHKNKKELYKESISFRLFIEGEVFYIRFRAYLHQRLPDGSIRLEGYAQNITDIQRRRNDITTLTHAINNAKESIFAANEDGTLSFANRQFLLNNGISENEDISKLKIYDILRDISSLEAWKVRCKDIQNEGSYEFITYNPSKINKEILAHEGFMYSITSDSGKESYWSFAHDISERIRYEAQIKHLDRILGTTIDNLPAGIIVRDIDNDFQYIYRNRESFNREFCVENENGKNDFDFYPPEVAKNKRKEDLEVASTSKILHWTTEVKDKNGRQLILDKRKMRIDGDELSPSIIISIEWDITELENMRREIQASKERAELSDKQKSAFLANMSHEIRTPLNVIVGFSQLIAESLDMEERKSYYDVIEASNERLLNLINEILDLSRIESGIVKFVHAPVNLDHLCREVYDTHVFRTPEGVKLVYESSDRSLMIHTDKNRIFQVLSNLIGNSFKFTKEGLVNYGFELKENMVIFHVTDTGVGIDPEKIEQVFDRFAKLNNADHGSGLGLSICKTIVERLGGEISVTSEIGKGSTFIFTLPYNWEQLRHKTIKDQSVESLQVVEEKPHVQPTPIYKKHPFRQITILIAEDVDCNYNLLTAVLGKEYKIVRAHDGMEVVMMYEEVKPDLILMDLKMPNLDGLEATRIIRELSSDIPIIAQSAYLYDYDWKAAKEAGCNDFISKPTSQVKLKELISRWLP